ncbi:MAG: Mur ligase family protein, partial [Gammaproteobacteria bacterium]|nr:Mur ligase family protein [Gammaproteobacteria bacterium]
IILEVGLGGRLDAVNLVDADVAVISNIQLDHTDWLGETREQIAVEKLGIARKGKPIIIADDDLPENVLQILAEREIPAYLLGQNFGFTRQSDSWNWWLDNISDDVREDRPDAKESSRQQKHSLPLPALRGPHQYKNASAALSVTSILNAELPLSMNHIRVGLGNVSLPGRFQFERVDDKTVILDVAHNPHGVQAFIENLKQLPAIGENYLVFAMLKDKSIGEVVSLLDPVVDHWLVADIDSDRAVSVADLANTVNVTKNSASEVGQYQSVADACNDALNKMQPNDYLLVVGSFLTVADALLCNLQKNNLQTS